MVLLGEGFSPAFAELVLLTDAAILLIVILAVFFGRIASACVAGLRRASAMLACAIAHISARQK